MALPGVDARLKTPPVARCTLPARADHDAREIVTYAKCWEAAYHAAAARHLGLAKAVDVRERATRKALAAAKG